ncbi:hypothetical protein SAMN05720354_106137 [Nitrosospira sp. Nsp1]|nr:hypothetical protein SAMN05720354_106137 [Nitrosospira sp. Nsp1]
MLYCYYRGVGNKMAWMAPETYSSRGNKNLLAPASVDQRGILHPAPSGLTGNSPVKTGITLSKQKVPLRHRQNIFRPTRQQLPVGPHLISFGIDFHLWCCPVMDHVLLA